MTHCWDLDGVGSWQLRDRNIQRRMQRNDLVPPAVHDGKRHGSDDTFGNRPWGSVGFHIG